MKLLAKLSFPFISLIIMFLCSQNQILAQEDIKSGSSVFVFESQIVGSGTSAGGTQQKPTKYRRRAMVSVKKNTTQTPKPKPKIGGKKPVQADEPIAPESWINESAAFAVEERAIADGEPLLFLSEGFLNSRINFCEAPKFPEAARKAKLKKVRLRLSVTIAKYGGVLDAQVIEGDAIFRQAVYDSLDKGLRFRQSYFMGEPVRIQGIVEFTQHDSDSYNMISCRDGVKDAELPAVIDGGDLSDNATFCETPQFPADAKAANLKSVEAKVQVIVDEKGKVTSAKLIEGHPTFGQAAVQSALKTTFRRSLITEQYVKVSGVMTFTQTADNSVKCKYNAPKEAVATFEEK